MRTSILVSLAAATTSAMSCGPRAAPNSPGPNDVATEPAPIAGGAAAALPIPDLESTPLVGSGCLSVETLSWSDRGSAIELDGTGISANRPDGWHRAPSRPDVVVLVGPSQTGESRPVIELINAAACSTYDSTLVHRRLAIRALQDLVGAGEAANAWDTRSNWSGKLAPPATSILSAGKLIANGRPLSLVTYYTEIAGGSNLVVVFAAACDGTLTTATACQRAYRELVDTLRTP